MSSINNEELLELEPKITSSPVDFSDSEESEENVKRILARLKYFNNVGESSEDSSGESCVYKQDETRVICPSPLEERVPEYPLEDNTFPSMVIGAAGVPPERDGRLRVKISLGGHTGCALVDTGATFSMIAKGWVTEKNLDFESKKGSTFKGFGVGNSVNIVGKLRTIPQIGTLQLAPQDFQIIDFDLQGSVPIVLGTDFLKENLLQVDPARAVLRQVTKQGLDMEAHLDYDGTCQMVCRRAPCYAAETIKLSAGDEKLVKVTCPQKLISDFTHVGVDPNLMLISGAESNDQLSVFDGLTEVSEVMRVYVTTQHENSVIREGDCIASVSSLIVLPPEAEFHINVESTEGSSGTTDSTGVLDWKIITEKLSHLSEEQRKGVLAMLQSRSQVFSTGDDDIGQMGLTEHHIKLSDETPIYQRPRRLPDPVSEEIDAQCRELTLLDIIEPSSSPWSSPVVPVRKKDGSIRMCIDYRKLNAVTIPDRFPLPNLSDAVFSLHGATYFTSLDLVRGYYQLPLAEGSRPYTAFSTPRGHYQFKRLSFGLRNAPAAFQREMTQVLAGFPHCRVIVYIDDVLIISNTLEEHMGLVNRVLATLEDHGIKVKPTKCSWFSSEVEYLGHVVGSDGVRKCDKFIEQVQEVPRPTTVRQLREFLGLTNFQRKFVPNFSVMQKPLSEKLKGKGSKKITWTDEMEDAFLNIKEKLKDDVTLAYPDYSRGASDLELYVDASGVGAGACLCQQQGEEMRIIAYASTTFGSIENNYSTIELELAALRWGVKTFRPFIIGVQFVIHTDHQPLIYLHNMKLVDSRLARTVEDLADFNYSIRYTPGSQNSAADCLSRLYDPHHVHNSCPNFDAGKLPDGISLYGQVPGGGDSLLESLFVVLQRTIGSTAVPTHSHLRRVLVGELTQHHDLYGVKLDRLARKKLKLMQHGGQLPGVEFIFAFGELYKCVVLVHFGGERPIGYYPPSIARDQVPQYVHLQCLSGVHYNPAFAEENYRDVDQVSYLKPVLERSVGPTDSSDFLEQEQSIEPYDLTEVPCSTQLEPKTNLHTVTGAGETKWCPAGVHAREHEVAILVEVMGQALCALLDTGAQTSCIGRSVVDSLGLTIDTSFIFNMFGFGNNSSKSLGVVDLAVPLPGAGRIDSNRFVVVEDFHMPYCLILGIDYLKQEKISFDFERGRFLVKGVPLLDVNMPPVHLMVGSPGNVASVLAVVPQISNGVRIIHVGTIAEHLPFEIQRDGSGEAVALKSIISTEQALKHQKSCQQLRKLRNFIIKKPDKLPRNLSRFSRAQKHLVVDGGVIFYDPPTLNRVVVVNFPFLVELVLTLHYQMTHMGRQKLIELIQESVWHPSISKVAGEVTQSCDLCQRMKVSSSFAPPMLKVVARYPFETVAVDLVALEPVAGFSSCLVAVDHHTKWLAVVPLRNKTSRTVSDAFEHRILPQLVNKPTNVLSDNGGEFRGQEFNAVLARYGITHLYTTPNKPSSNGLVERANRTLLQLLKIEKRQNGVSWINALPKVVMVHNQSYHSALETSPMEFILSGQHLINGSGIIPTDVI